MTIATIQKLSEAEITKLIKGEKNYCESCNRRIGWNCFRRGNGDPLCWPCAELLGFYKPPPWQR